MPVNGKFTCTNGGKSVLITYPTLYNQGSSVSFPLYIPMYSVPKFQIEEFLLVLSSENMNRLTSAIFMAEYLAPFCAIIIQHTLYNYL